jgi:hypothetical protein
MAVSEAKLKANRENAKKSTGPRSNPGKFRSSKNAVKHGLTSQIHVALSEQDHAEIVERFDAWAPELVPTGNRVAMDLTLLASRSYQRTLNAYRSEDAEAAARVRRAGENWDVKQRKEVMELVSMLDKNPMVAVAGLRTTVAGLDWLIEEFRAMKLLIETHQWEDKYHQRVRKLLGCDNESPNLAHTVPDVWNEFIKTLVNMHRVFDKPLQLFPWQKLLLEVNQFNARCQAQEKRYNELYEDGTRFEIAYMEMLATQIADLESLRVKLADKEAADRAEAGQRALFDGGEATKLRLRYIADAQRDMYRALKEIRELQKVERDTEELSDPSGEPETPAEPPPPVSRNEPTASPARPSTNKQLPGPPAREALNAPPKRRRGGGV